MASACLGDPEKPDPPPQGGDRRRRKGLLRATAAGMRAIVFALDTGVMKLVENGEDLDPTVVGIKVFAQLLLVAAAWLKNRK